MGTSTPDIACRSQAFFGFFFSGCSRIGSRGIISSVSDMVICRIAFFKMFLLIPPKYGTSVIMRITSLSFMSFPFPFGFQPGRST